MFYIFFVPIMRVGLLRDSVQLATLTVYISETVQIEYVRAYPGEGFSSCRKSFVFNGVWHLARFPVSVGVGVGVEVDCRITPP